MHSLRPVARCFSKGRGRAGRKLLAAESSRTVRVFSSTRLGFKSLSLPPAWPRDPNGTTETAPSRSQMGFSDRIKGSMRQIAHPLAIITTPSLDLEPDSSPPSTSVTGLLVSSFNTVSLFPNPVISFNLKLPSTTYTSIASSRTFDVSFPWGRHICDSFSSPEKRDALNATEIAFLIKTQTVFRYQCEWLKEKSVEVGDHVIMIGKVTGFVHGDVVEEGRLPFSRRPLAYRNGKYTKLGHHQFQVPTDGFPATVVLHPSDEDS